MTNSDVPLMPRRVIKLGGSLLDWDEWIPQFREWLARQYPAENLLIVGGGKLADWIREADRVHHLGESDAHWLCIRAMAVQAELARCLLPEAAWLSSIRGLSSETPNHRLSIIDPWQFMTVDDPQTSPAPLPTSWDVTSDSIAARLAAIVGAVDLVLLKSALPDNGRLDIVESLVEAGYVDRYFGQAAANLNMVRLVNLRRPAFPEVKTGREISSELAAAVAKLRANKL
jgi:aspartokinase-like uncharacterized kinase